MDLGNCSPQEGHHKTATAGLQVRSRLVERDWQKVCNGWSQPEVESRLGQVSMALFEHLRPAAHRCDMHEQTSYVAAKFDRQKPTLLNVTLSSYGVQPGGRIQHMTVSMGAIPPNRIAKQTIFMSSRCTAIQGTYLCVYIHMSLSWFLGDFRAAPASKHAAPHRSIVGTTVRCPLLSGWR